MRRFWGLIFIGLMWWLMPVKVWATACTATVSPPGLPPNSAGITVTIILQNTGDDPINFIEIQRPFFDDMTYSAGNIEGCERAESEYYTEFQNGSLAPSLSLTIGGVANTAETDGLEGSWGISASDTGEGGQIGCEGDFSAYSNSSIDLAAPSISSVAVSVLSTTSVRVSWTTNENAISQVDYGTSSGSYGGNVAGGTPKTSHSLTIEGLTAGTAYYVRSKSTDEAGNIGYSGEYSFTMPTPTQTITTETTVTITQTLQAKPTIIVERDVTPPSVTMATGLEGIFLKAPVVSGSATDGKGIYKVD